MSEKMPVKSDGRGILAGDYLNVDRPITRSVWLEEVFPEWGTYLNKEIARTSVEPGTFVLWWLGGPSWVMKSRQGTFLIDNYAGPSIYTTYDYCGVCRTSGAPSLEWMRTNPMVIDPWAFESLDAVLCTHHHQDHCDIYTIKAALQTTEAQFVGPARTCERFKRFGVPDDRILCVKPGDAIKIKDVEIAVEENYDTIACMTGDYDPNAPKDFASVAVSFVMKTEGHSVIFLGDTLYHNGYRAVGKRHSIDVAIFNMGHNAPGMTDKMNPFDAFRVGQALNAKVLIPDHYDNWASSKIDPGQLERIVAENDPNMKTVILQHGAKFVYPRDANIGRYRYPDFRERFRPEYSWEYGRPEKK